MIWAINRSAVGFFVHMSSAKVYGEQSLDSIGFHEQSELRPASSYAKMKVRSEKVVEKGLADKTHYLILRPPMVYANSQVSPALKNIERLLKCGLPIPISKDGGNSRSVISLDNLCKTIGLILFTKERLPSGVYNISEEHCYSCLDLVELTARITGRKSRAVRLNESMIKFFMMFPIINKMICSSCRDFVINDSKLRSHLIANK